MRNKSILVEIRKILDVCKDCKKLTKKKLLSKSKNIRYIINLALSKYNNLDIIYQMDETKFKLLQYKEDLVNFDNYIEIIENKPNNSTYIFLKLLVAMSKDEYTLFDGNKNDCKYDEIMSKAQTFNTIFEKGRSLAGCYDCGTIGRAVFMSFIKMKNGCYNISNESHKKILKDYCEKYSFENYNIKNISSNYSFEEIDNSLERADDFKKELTTKNEHNIFICSISLSDGIGHIWIFEKLPNFEYRLYQSSLNEYLLIDYLNYMNYNGKNNLQEKDINAFIKNLIDLINLKEWNNTIKNKYYNLFFHNPNIKLGTKFDFKFMYSGLY